MLPTQRPITVKAGSLTAVLGASPTKLDRLINGSPMTVQDFGAADAAGFQIILPEGYGLDDMDVRFLWYANDASAGSVTWTVSIKAVGAGESIPANPAPSLVISASGGAADILNVSDFVTVPVASSPARSNQYHFLFARVGLGYPLAASLADVQIMYSRDRHSDAVI